MTRMLILAFSVLVGYSANAQERRVRPVTVVISQGSTQINHIEIRTGANLESLRFFSLEAAKKALGAPEDTYVPRGVRVYAWRSTGIHLQRGWRGPEKGKLFKLQIYFEDDYDSDVHKHTGSFTGTVRVDGIDVAPDTPLRNLRSQLEDKGYQVTDDTAEKAEIRILAINPRKTVDRIEQWCD